MYSFDAIYCCIVDLKETSTATWSPEKEVLQHAWSKTDESQKPKELKPDAQNTACMPESMVESTRQSWEAGVRCALT